MIRKNFEQPNEKVTCGGTRHPNDVKNALNQMGRQQIPENDQKMLTNLGYAWIGITLGMNTEGELTKQLPIWTFIQRYRAFQYVPDSNFLNSEKRDLPVTFYKNLNLQEASKTIEVHDPWEIDKKNAEEKIRGVQRFGAVMLAKSRTFGYHRIPPFDDADVLNYADDTIYMSILDPSNENKVGSYLGVKINLDNLGNADHPQYRLQIVRVGTEPESASKGLSSTLIEHANTWLQDEQNIQRLIEMQKINLANKAHALYQKNQMKADSANQQEIERLQQIHDSLSMNSFKLGPNGKPQIFLDGRFSIEQDMIMFYHRLGYLVQPHKFKDNKDLTNIEMVYVGTNITKQADLYARVLSKIGHMLLTSKKKYKPEFDSDADYYTKLIRATALALLPPRLHYLLDDVPTPNKPPEDAPLFKEVVYTPDTLNEAVQNVCDNFSIMHETTEDELRKHAERTLGIVNDKEEKLLPGDTVEPLQFRSEAMVRITTHFVKIATLLGKTGIDIQSLLEMGDYGIHWRNLEKIIDQEQVALAIAGKLAITYDDRTGISTPMTNILRHFVMNKETNGLTDTQLMLNTVDMFKEVLGKMRKDKSKHYETFIQYCLSIVDATNALIVDLDPEVNNDADALALRTFFIHLSNRTLVNLSEHLGIETPQKYRETLLSANRELDHCKTEEKKQELETQMLNIASVVSSKLQLYNNCADKKIGLEKKEFADQNARYAHYNPFFELQGEEKIKRTIIDLLETVKPLSRLNSIKTYRKIGRVTALSLNTLDTIAVCYPGTPMRGVANQVVTTFLQYAEGIKSAFKYELSTIKSNGGMTWTDADLIERLSLMVADWDIGSTYISSRKNMAGARDATRQELLNYTNLLEQVTILKDLISPYQVVNAKFLNRIALKKNQPI